MTTTKMTTTKMMTTKMMTKTKKQGGGGGKNSAQPSPPGKPIKSGAAAAVATVTKNPKKRVRMEKDSKQDEEEVAQDDDDDDDEEEEEEDASVHVTSSVDDDSAASLADLELDLPLRVALGSYQGALYGLETIRPARSLIASAASPATASHATPAAPLTDTDSSQAGATTATSSTTVSSSCVTIFGMDAHRASVQTLASSACGMWLASSGPDETIQVFNTSTMRHHGTLHVHNATVSAMCFYSTHYFLSADDSGVIFIWRTRPRWERIGELKGHTSRVLDLAVHPSGKLMLSIGKDLTLRVWDLVHGKLAATRTVSRLPSLLRWSPSGAHYALVMDREVHVFDQNGALERRIEHASKVLSIVYVHDRVLISGCDDHTISLWDAHSGQQLFTLQQHAARVRCLDALHLARPAVSSRASTVAAALPPRSFLFSASTDGQMFVWNITSVVDPFLTGADDAAERVSALQLQPVAGAKSSARITSICSITFYSPDKCDALPSKLAAVSAAVESASGNGSAAPAAAKSPAKASAKASVGQAAAMGVKQLRQQQKQKQQQKEHQKPQQKPQKSAVAIEPMKKAAFVKNQGGVVKKVALSIKKRRVE